MKALVWKEEYQGRSIGQIERTGQDQEIESYSHHLKSKMEIVDVPAELEGEQVFDLEASGEVGEFVISLSVSKDKANRIAAAYKVMNDEIYDEMAVVFGTKSADSANAQKQTYELMIQAPDDYSSLGLEADFSVGSISQGDALDSDSLINEYAVAKLADISAYSIFRLQKIKAFKQAKAAIEAE
tara:strand:+ start:54112 stop:54663 length:552 start_codon:yes stop_codon:yes gene_type:complete